MRDETSGSRHDRRREGAMAAAGEGEWRKGAARRAEGSGRSSANSSAVVKMREWSTSTDRCVGKSRRSVNGCAGEEQWRRPPLSPASHRPSLSGPLKIPRRAQPSTVSRQGGRTVPPSRLMARASASQIDLRRRRSVHCRHPLIAASRRRSIAFHHSPPLPVALPCRRLSAHRTCHRSFLLRLRSGRGVRW